MSSTSPQRTYRYLRIAIVGAAAVLLLGLVVVAFSDGPVMSVSAMFYTSGRSIFVGALCAIALGFIALSGRSVEQVLLNIAALFAALIAVVPTPVGAGDAPGPVSCPGGSVCVPPAELPGVHSGVIVLGIAAILGAILALVLAWVQHAVTVGIGIGVLSAVAVGAGMLVWTVVAPGALAASGHLVATAVFFCLLVAVAVISAVAAPHASAHASARAAARTSTRRGPEPWRIVYTVVAVGMVACLAYLVGVEVARLSGVDLSGQPWVLFGEVGLIGLFAAFWIAQTVQKWDEGDPSLLPVR